jgi:ribosomal protein S18 acetylase RimI-like enzyme
MMIIDRSTHSDIVRLAEIHYMALPDDFLPSLGLDFLAKVYYPASMKSTSAVTLTARDQGRVVGFVTLAHDSAQYTRDVISKSWIALGLYALRVAILHPSSIWKSMEVLQAALFSKPDPIQSEIVFIAVDPTCQGQGIGTRLVTSSIEYLAQMGIYQCRTKTLARNEKVIRMYERLGWHVRDQFSLIGNQYVFIVMMNRDV